MQTQLISVLHSKLKHVTYLPTPKKAMQENHSPAIIMIAQIVVTTLTCRRRLWNNFTIYDPFMMQ